MTKDGNFDSLISSEADKSSAEIAFESKESDASDDVFRSDVENQVCGNQECTEPVVVRKSKNTDNSNINECVDDLESGSNEFLDEKTSNGAIKIDEEENNDTDSEEVVVKKCKTRKSVTSKKLANRSPKTVERKTQTVQSSEKRPTQKDLKPAIKRTRKAAQVSRSMSSLSEENDSEDECSGSQEEDNKTSETHSLSTTNSQKKPVANGSNMVISKEFDTSGLSKTELGLLEWAHTINRPFNKSELKLALSSLDKATVLERAAMSLADKNFLQCKTYKASKIYMVVQAEVEDETDYDSLLETEKISMKEMRCNYDAVSDECKKLREVMTEEELKAEIEAKKAVVKKNEEILRKVEAGERIIDKKDVERLEKETKSMLKLQKERAGKFKEILDILLEGMEMSKEALFEEAGIEEV